MIDYPYSFDTNLKWEHARKISVARLRADVVVVLNFRILDGPHLKSSSTRGIVGLEY